MANEMFYQRLRSGEKPHGNRSTTREPVQNTKALAELKAAAEIPTGLEHRRISLPDGPVTHERVKVVPLYGAQPLTRSYRIWQGKRTGSKPARHPMRGFRSVKAAHRNAA